MAKEEAAKTVAAQKLLVAQQGKLGAMMNSKGKSVDLKQGKRLSHHHLSAMSPVIRERWIASVIAGFIGNSFTAKVLKAHLTIINSEIDKIPRSELLQEECSKSLLKEAGKPVLADVNARLPVSWTRTQLVQLLLGSVAAEGRMED